MEDRHGRPRLSGRSTDLPEPVDRLARLGRPTSMSRSTDASSSVNRPSVSSRPILFGAPRQEDDSRRVVHLPSTSKASRSMPPAWLGDADSDEQAMSLPIETFRVRFRGREGRMSWRPGMPLASREGNWAAKIVRESRSRDFMLFTKCL